MMIMKFPATICLGVIGFSLLALTLALTSTETQVIQHTDAVDSQNEGFWNHQVTWKSRWVKYWQEKTVYVPVWKKVWSPLVQKEWVPLPNTPQGYTKPNEQYNIQEVEY